MYRYWEDIRWKIAKYIDAIRQTTEACASKLQRMHPIHAAFFKMLGASGKSQETKAVGLPVLEGVGVIDARGTTCSTFNGRCDARV